MSDYLLSTFGGLLFPTPCKVQKEESPWTRSEVRLQVPAPDEKHIRYAMQQTSNEQVIPDPQRVQSINRTLAELCWCGNAPGRYRIDLHSLLKGCQRGTRSGRPDVEKPMTYARVLQTVLRRHPNNRDARAAAVEALTDAFAIHNLRFDSTTLGEGNQNVTDVVTLPGHPHLVIPRFFFRRQTKLLPYQGDFKEDPVQLGVNLETGRLIRVVYAFRHSEVYHLHEQLSRRGGGLKLCDVVLEYPVGNGESDVVMITELSDEKAMDACLPPVVSSGAFGRVYVLPHRDEVLKVQAANATAKREVEILVALKALTQDDHSNIVRIIDHFEVPSWEGGPVASLVIRQPYCRGGRITTVLRSRSPAEVSSRHLLHLFRQIVSAALIVHSAGFIHRDLNPNNILIEDADRPLLELVVKIIDFGISSQRSVADTFAGTPGYVADEVNERSEYNQSVDTYSLGCVLQTLNHVFDPFFVAGCRNGNGRCCCGCERLLCCPLCPTRKKNAGALFDATGNSAKPVVARGKGPDDMKVNELVGALTSHANVRPNLQTVIEYIDSDPPEQCVLYKDGANQIIREDE
ncbi:putative serine/threonine-protein kinase zyg-1 [Diplonema papillatum]|nr:putative serine/threonine-protein kinase zyg-1 [Diplonema papillatum]|eukprot:gene8254-12739_t